MNRRSAENGKETLFLRGARARGIFLCMLQERTKAKLKTR